MHASYTTEKEEYVHYWQVTCTHQLEGGELIKIHLSGRETRAVEGSNLAYESTKLAQIRHEGPDLLNLIVRRAVSHKSIIQRDSIMCQ